MSSVKRGRKCQEVANCFIMNLMECIGVVPVTRHSSVVTRSMSRRCQDLLAGQVFQRQKVMRHLSLLMIIALACIELKYFAKPAEATWATCLLMIHHQMVSITA